MVSSFQQVVERERARAAQAEAALPLYSEVPAPPQCLEVAPPPLYSEAPAAEPKQSCPWYTQLGWAMFIVGSIVAAVLTGGASLIGSVAVLPFLF